MWVPKSRRPVGCGGCHHRSSGVQLPLSRRNPPRTTPAARGPAFLVLCNLFLSGSNLSNRLSFLLSLYNLLDLNLHLMFFVRRLPSLQSTWPLQRSVTGCCPSCCLCVTPFHTSSVLCCCTSRNRFSNSAAFYRVFRLRRALSKE